MPASHIKATPTYWPDKNQPTRRAAKVAAIEAELDEIMADIKDIAVTDDDPPPGFVRLKNGALVEADYEFYEWIAEGPIESFHPYTERIPAHADADMIVSMFEDADLGYQVIADTNRSWWPNECDDIPWALKRDAA